MRVPRSFRIGVMATALGAAWPAAAPAQTSPADAPATTAVDLDTLYLRDGRVLRGTIVAVVPDVEVRIRLPAGDVIAVPRRDVMNFIYGQSEQSERPSPPTPAPSPPIFWPSQLPTTHLQLHGSGAAELQYATPEGAWATVCSTPCERNVPAEGRYRIAGPGVKPSAPFSLQARAGYHVSLDVHAATKNGFVSGVVVLAAGPPIAFLATIATASALNPPINGGGHGSPVGNAVVAAGVVGIVASIALGVGLMIANGSTTVDEGFSPGSAVAPVTTPPFDHHEPPLAGAIPPPVFGLPIATVRF